jgi:multidrug efflux pump
MLPASPAALAGATVTGAISREAGILGVNQVLVPATAGLFKAVPGGFMPAQDKQ